MSNDIVAVEPRKLESQFRSVCSTYGVQCKAITQSTGIYSSEQDLYLVLSLGPIPDDINARELYIRQERSNVLLYTDYFVLRVNNKIAPLGLIDDVISYCQAIEFLQKIFAEYYTPLPPVIRGEDVEGLEDYYGAKRNMLLAPEFRAHYAQGLKDYFEQERSKSKYRKKWRDFSRTDKFDRRAKRIKKYLDFFKRKSQITTVPQLQQTNSNLKTLLINEHEFEKFKKEMQNRYPDVLYAISNIEVRNTGYDEKQGENAAVDKVAPGPYGKLISYRVYCEEREKRFATEGFKALEDLSPSYYECRQLTYKAIDEPFIAKVLNPIRFAYAKSDPLSTISHSNYENLPYVDIPLNDMMPFVALAKERKIPFYLDFDGKFGAPKLDQIRAVCSLEDKVAMATMLQHMVQDKCRYSHVVPSTPTKAHVPLDVNIGAAQFMLLQESSRPAAEVAQPSREI